MNEGRIVEYIDQGSFICTLCLQDKGNRLHVLTPLNREVNLSPKRAIFISGVAHDPQGPREVLLEHLKHIDDIRNRLKIQVDVRELWELIEDENESFAHRYLAQLVFGDEITDDHLSALVRALFEDGLYFKLKNGRFYPKSQERVKQIVSQREEAARKEEKLHAGSTWLKAVLNGEDAEAPPGQSDIIELLVQIALYGTEAQDFKYGKEMLLRAGISDISQARCLLIKLGIWEEDENLDLIRLEVPVSFSQEELDESARLFSKAPDYRGREDFTDLPVITIDGPLTRDYDDALSLESAGDGFRLGVHIAEVAGFIVPGSSLDRAAAERASSIYLPRKQIPMLPPDLSQGVLSLQAGCDRPAISLITQFDRHGRLLDYRFTLSVIRVQRQLTYEEVNGSLGTEKSLEHMHELSRQLRKERMEGGALSLSLPDLEVTFNEDATLSLRLVSQDTPSKMIVAELMILYNHLAAKFCSEHEIPILFRSQAEPSERLPTDETGYLYYAFQQRRRLSPLRIETSPRPHSGLGLDMYTHVTSPIRRYLDLVVQRQMRNFLMGMKPVYEGKLLEEIQMRVGPSIRDIEAVKRNRLRYWIIRYLGENRDKAFKAIVLDEFKTRYRILLCDFLLVTEMKRKEGVVLSPGEEILVEVKAADPVENQLELVYGRS